MAGLSLTLRRFDKIQIGDVTITFTRKNCQRVTLAIEAPIEKKIAFIPCEDIEKLKIRKGIFDD